MGLFDSVRPGFFDHVRFIGDLRDTSQEIENSRRRGVKIKPPLTFLTRLGKDMIHATDGDHGALRLRREAESTADLAALPFGRAFGGALEFNWLMAAIILGRDDLANRFQHAGRLSFDKGLQWLVLRGITEHRLWHIVTPSFVKELSESKIPGSGFTPLQLMLIREKPALARLMQSENPARDEVAFSRWLLDHGDLEFGLFWCLPSHQSRKRRRQRIAANVMSLLTRPSRARMKDFLRTPKSPALVLSPHEARPITASLVQEGQRRLTLLRSIDSKIGTHGRPLCFWSGMAGELAIVDGQHGAPNHQGMSVTGSSITFLMPETKSHPHTIVLETLSKPTEFEADIHACRVNGRLSPVIRLADGPRNLWLFDIAANRRVAAAPAVPMSSESETHSRELKGHVVWLQLGPERQGEGAVASGQLFLSRVWTF